MHVFGRVGQAEGFAKGELCMAMAPWRELNAVNAEQLKKVPEGISPADARRICQASLLLFQFLRVVFQANLRMMMMVMIGLLQFMLFLSVRVCVCVSTPVSKEDAQTN